MHGGMEQTSMRLDLRSLARGLRRFWRWWMSELTALVPRPLKERIGRLFATLEIVTDGSTLAVSHRQGGEGRQVAEVAHAGRDPQAVAAELRALVEGIDGTYDRLVLVVAPERTLHRRFAMPSAARDSLREAVGYDIDRQTPFTEDQVYFAVEEVDVRPEDEITVRLAVVRRADVDSALEVLWAAGLLPDRIRAGNSGDAAADLEVPAARMRSGILWPRATALLAGLAIALFGAAILLPLSRVENEFAQVEAEMGTARAAAVRVERLRREMLALAEAEGRLFERKREEPMVLTLLAEVTAAVPDSAFLLEFGFDGREVSLSGFADAASDAIAWIEGAPHLRGARFLSPVMQDQRLGRERFSMAAERVAAAPAADAGEGKGTAP